MIPTQVFLDFWRSVNRAVQRELGSGRAPGAGNRQCVRDDTALGTQVCDRSNAAPTDNCDALAPTPIPETVRATQLHAQGGIP